MKKPKPIYLDYAASVPLRPEVARAMRAAERVFGNPSSLHSFGQAARALVDRARERIAEEVGAGFREIAFTGSATEANNLALRGVVAGFRRQALGVSDRETKRILEPSAYRLAPRIIISAIEHESVLETARDLERSGEAELVVIPVNRRGIVDAKTLAAALDERTVLVSVMYVNNETGVIQPIQKIGEIIKSSKQFGPELTAEGLKAQSLFPLFHTDASQALAYLDCDVGKLGVDLMTLSGHKIGGPRGIGALYVRNLKSSPIGGSPEGRQTSNLKSIITGGEQEFGLRAGTENVAAIAGFAKAVELAVGKREKNRTYIAHIRELFLRELERARVKFIENVPREGVSSHILNLRFPGLAAEEFLVRLDLAGVAVSAGSACTARAVLPSHVLLAMGMPRREVEECVRVSFGVATTSAEVREAARRFA
ncbi:MAG: cysteine desulfurase family protein [Candidatus Jorgensenbacteria bacterium]